MRVTSLASWLPEALLLFFASAFVLPNQSAYALIFYLACLPPILASLTTTRPPLTTPLALALALILFSGATLLWGHDDGHRSFRFAWDSFNTLCFVLGMALAFRDPALRRRLATLLTWLGGLNAGFAILVGAFHHGAGPRLHGWGATSHPILGASVMTVAYLTALWRGLAGPGHRLASLGAAAVMAGFILLTESRGPLLAASVATLFLCAAGPWRLRALSALAACAVIWLLLPASVQHHAETVIVQRGASHRFEIWRYTARIIAERPLFGHGLADNLHLDVFDPQGRGFITEHITFPHDLYLSLLFYSGAAGLLLFAALAASFAAQLWRRRDEGEFPWLGALGLNVLFAGLTDLGQVTKGPGPLWFILWVPAGLMLSWRPRSDAAQGCPVPPPAP